LRIGHKKIRSFSKMELVFFLSLTQKTFRLLNISDKNELILRGWVSKRKGEREERRRGRERERTVREREKRTIKRERERKRKN